MFPSSSSPTRTFAWRRAATRLPSMVAVTLLALGAAGCDDITGPGGRLYNEQRDLTWARRTWTAQYITDYEYVVRRDCYCGLGGVAVRVTVQGDRVVAREIDGTSTPIPSSMNYLYPTIGGLFALVQDAIDTRAYEVDTSYDPRYGFPTDIWIDYDRRTADDEEGYVLLRFRSLMR
ncbi:MAG: DUF6174 domain-containing protein [Gemmatimonadaceae bacterium]